MRRIVKQNTEVPKDWPGASAKSKNDFVHSEVLFDKQLAFVQDKSPFRIAVCSRRSGKTYVCAYDLLNTAMSNPDVICMYITLSWVNAKRIVFPALEKLNHDYKLGARVDYADLSFKFKNGSQILLLGASDESKIKRLRGISRLKLCYIDECQSFPGYIEELIDDVVAPALIDLAGDLCLIGTPGPVPAGYFYNAWINPDWSKHAWTYFDNPHIPDHQARLNRELKRRGVEIEDPSIQREWFGKWVLDSDSLLLHYDKAKNDFSELPIGTWTHILGVDIGFNDADALAVLAWNTESPDIYLVEEQVTSGQDITELTNAINAMTKKYDVSKIMIDAGGLGKKIAEELIRRHQIPLVAADKTRKMENVALLNDFLRSGRFKASGDSKFAVDCMLVEIDRSKSTPEKIKVKDSYHSDIIDAVLYAFKESYAYTYQKPIEKPKAGTPAWFTEEEDRMEEAAFEYFKAQEDASKGYSDDY